MFSGQIEFDPVKDSQALTYQLDECLALRPLSPSDADVLFSLVDSNRLYLRQWLPWLDNNQSVDDSLEFIRDSRERAGDNNGFALAICYEAQLVGIVGLNYISWENRLSGIGYWLAEQYQGKGLVTRACKAVLDYGFTDLNLNRIDIRCAPKNLRSQAVAERLGLTYEGTLRDAEWLYEHFVDHRVYSMLQREWRSPTS
ncbi:MAG: GNAT family protein [Phormidesmis sp.]